MTQTRNTRKRTAWLGAAILLLASAGTAHAQGGPGDMGPDDALGFVGFESGLAGKTVTGAPFTANFSTETMQTLSDGNNIDRKTTGSFARDGQGRTRRDITLPAIGAFATSNNGGTPPHGVVISDPVAGVSYVLNENKKVARKLNLPPNPLRRNGGNGPNGQQRPDSPNVTTQSLGNQTIGGVAAEGTRTTRTIPAGQIGNAKPIELTVERWYSAELQTDILIKRNDPRGGQTTFQMTNIVRSEPDASLFQVPSDYTVEQGRGPGGLRRGGPREGGAPPPPPAQ